MTKTFLFALFLFLITGTDVVAVHRHQPPGEAQTKTDPPRIEVVYDQEKDLTTVRIRPSPISGERDIYHSVDYSVAFTYPGRTRRAPEALNFEIVSVVKARKLNPDLYVTFLFDGEAIHFSSNRSAMRNPVPGRRWIGERMIFSIPFQSFLKFETAEHTGVKLGNVTFDFDDATRDSLRTLAQMIKNY
jgi:hypothetical protein